MSQEALLELSPLRQFQCPQEKGEFRELGFRDTLLSHFLFIVVGHHTRQTDRGHFIDKETEASVYWPKILWSENRRA